MQRETAQAAGTHRSPHENHDNLGAEAKRADGDPCGRNPSTFPPVKIERTSIRTKDGAGHDQGRTWRGPEVDPDRAKGGGAGSDRIGYGIDWDGRGAGGPVRGRAAQAGRARDAG